MFGSGYKIITLVGTSKESWEKIAGVLHNSSIRIQELDMYLGDDKIITYRVKVRVHSKNHGEEEAIQTITGVT